MPPPGALCMLPRPSRTPVRARRNRVRTSRGSPEGEESTPKRKKRGNSEGTIDQRPSGTWRGRIMVGYLPDGKPDRRTVSGATRKEVQKQLRELQQRAEIGLAGDARAGKETVAVFLGRWLAAIEGTIRPSTLYRYKINVENHLVPAFG